MTLGDDPVIRAPLSSDWTAVRSRAVEAYRYLPDEGVLQVLYRQGRKVYDFPCDQGLFERFQAAPSAGRFVQYVLRPHARRLGWSRPAYRFRG